MRTGKEIALEAKKYGICEQWYLQMLKTGDIAPLCKMYFDGSDWAMEKDFPPLDVLRKFKGKSEQYGIYTDFKGTIRNPQRAAFFGESDAEVIYDDYGAGQLVVRHLSKVRITAGMQAFVILNVLDAADVQVEKADSAKVNKYYGG